MKRAKICGVGTNDADYKLSRRKKIDEKWKKVWECPFYRSWRAMIVRCYNDKHLAKCPTYADCTVSDEWLDSFMAFCSWMIKQDWEGNCLDKDLMVLGNRLYSKDTCKFITSDINKLLVYSNGSSSGRLLGVALCKDRVKARYKASVYISGKSKHLGYYRTELEAHRVYLLAKIDVITFVAEDQEDLEIREGLYLHAEVLRDMYHNTYIGISKI